MAEQHQDKPRIFIEHEYEPGEAYAEHLALERDLVAEAKRLRAEGREEEALAREERAEELAHRRPLWD